jgi:hypothetical protein
MLDLIRGGLSQVNKCEKRRFPHVRRPSSLLSLSSSSIVIFIHSPRQHRYYTTNHTALSRYNKTQGEKQPIKQGDHGDTYSYYFSSFK